MSAWPRRCGAAQRKRETCAEHLLVIPPVVKICLEARGCGIDRSGRNRVPRGRELEGAEREPLVALGHQARHQPENIIDEVFFAIG